MTGLFSSFQCWRRSLWLPLTRFGSEVDLRQGAEMAVAGGQLPAAFLGDGGDPDVVGRDGRALDLELKEKLAVDFRRAEGHRENVDLRLFEEGVEFFEVFLQHLAFAEAVEQFADDDGWQDHSIRDRDLLVPVATFPPVAVGVGVQYENQLHNSESMRLRSLFKKSSHPAPKSESPA